MSSSPKDTDDGEDRERRELTQGLKSARDRARESPDERPKLPAHDVPEAPSALPSLPTQRSEPAPSSPERDDLNALWDVSDAFREPPRSRWGRLSSVLQRPLQRIVRFALGPVVERQVQLNSAQVRFDNETIRYVDERLDRISRHYDEVLGLHGKRMEEIDERHLILQQELIRHVHDLVERIEFVFESAESNHLYVEGVLREAREELQRLNDRLDALSAAQRETRS